MSVPSLYADVFIDRINLLISFSLGMNEAEAIGKSVHFLRVTCISLLVIFGTFYFQSLAHRKSQRNHGVFLLVWRTVDKIASFIQGFLTTIVVNIVTTKVSENDAENRMLTYSSKLRLYTAVILFIVATTIVFHWIFYEYVENDPARRLPQRLVDDLTTRDTSNESRKTR